MNDSYEMALFSESKTYHVNESDLDQIGKFVLIPNLNSMNLKVRIH